jgi:hypothetical protein
MSFGQALRSRNAAALLAILAGVLAYLLLCLYGDYSSGGNSWKQGDWLINELAEPVRRGLFGSALLLISDALGANPLLLLAVFQAMIVALIFAVIAAAVLSLGTPDKLLLLLLSPGFLVFFWFNDPQGSVRKEILAYVAFLPLIVAALRGKGGYIAYALSVGAYALAMASHEANVFFLPFLCVAIWLVLPSELSVKARLGFLVLPAALALAGGLYAVANTNVSDSGPMCLQLQQRGLDAAICEGAIAYLETAPADAHMNPTLWFSEHFRMFVLLYVVCVLAFRALLQGIANPDSWFLAVIASGLVFFPLYYLGGDYGRWLNFHVSSAVLVALVFLLKFRPVWLYERIGRVDFAMLLMMSVVFGVKHVPGELTDGALLKVARMAYELIA